MFILEDLLRRGGGQRFALPSDEELQLRGLAGDAPKL